MRGRSTLICWNTGCRTRPGLSLCREIRKVDPHAPIIFYASAVREQDRARAVSAGGPDAYLCKPVQPDELRAKLKSLVTLSEMESLRARIEEEHAVFQN